MPVHKLWQRGTDANPVFVEHISLDEREPLDKCRMG